MTPLDRLQSATRSPHLPLALLLLALSTVFLFGGMGEAKFTAIHVALRHLIKYS